MAVFAAAALLVASLGIMASSRTPWLDAEEIGIGWRGAQRSQLLASDVRQDAPVLVGLVAGVAVSLMLRRAIVSSIRGSTC